tara:strand:+ start:90 stop:380 length:291 start_codon:yes stop_codon:yes gene_type:complete
LGKASEIHKIPGETVYTHPLINPKSAVTGNQLPDPTFLGILLVALGTNPVTAIGENPPIALQTVHPLLDTVRFAHRHDKYTLLSNLSPAFGLVISF